MTAPHRVAWATFIEIIMDYNFESVYVNAPSSENSLLVHFHIHFSGKATLHLILTGIYRVKLADILKLAY